MKKVTKLFKTSLKSIDKDARTIKFAFSTDQVDRMGEVVEQSSWDTKNYESNPIILWGHDPSQAQNVIGRALSVETNVNGKSFVTAQFDDDEHSTLIFNKIVKGFLNTVSAGFIPHKIEFSDDDSEAPVLKDNELLEISVVPIPANPGAVALGLKEGSLTRKDAEYLIKSMKKEAELIESELAKDADAVVEKDVEELKAEITKLTTAVAALTENSNAITDAVTALVEASKPAAETEEQKIAREAKEKEEADKAEADRIAKEKEDADAAAAAANDGTNPAGAEGDELDEDAELTPEQEKELDDLIAAANE